MAPLQHFQIEREIERERERKKKRPGPPRFNVKIRVPFDFGARNNAHCSERIQQLMRGFSSKDDQKPIRRIISLSSCAPITERDRHEGRREKKKKRMLGEDEEDEES